MKRFKKLTAGLMGVVMALGVCSFTAFAGEDEKYAKGATIEISSDAELVNAIKNQADGQIWILKDGTYDIGDAVYKFTKADENKGKFTIAGDSNGFVFPIVANNLTIKGAEGKNSNVIITSDFDPNSGNWSVQDFITIGGKNVTIENINIKANPNGFEKGLSNKAIELAGDGKSLVLRNVELIPLENNDGKFSGSIYINVEDAGECVLEDVTLSAWVNTKKVNSGSVEVDGLTINAEGNAYAGKDGLGFAVSGDKVKVTGEGITVKVDDSIKLDEQIFNDQLKDGTTIELEDGTYKVDKTLQLNKDVVINGNGSTIIFTKNIVTPNNDTNCGFNITGGNSEINDLTIKGNGNVKHGINVFTGSGNATKVTIDSVNVYNCIGSGLQNNSSNVKVSNFNTSGNGWSGINVDNKYNIEDANFVMESGNITEETSVKIEKSIDGEGKQLTTKATIKGGTFEGKIEAKENSLLNIKGGTFEGEVEADSKDNLTIISGTFSNDVSDYKDSNSTLVKDEDGNFVIMDEEEYDKYLDSKRPSHSYELEEGRVDRNDEEEEPVVTTKPEEEAGPFSDVGKDNPNYDAIIKVYEKGWMAGIGDGVFAPNGTLTRAMGATVLWNKAGKPEPQNVAPFLDVTSDAWYAKAVAWAYEQGIVAGYGETFGPGDALTTEQFTRMNDIANGKTPEAYVGGAPNATRGWVASLLAM